MDVCGVPINHVYIALLICAGVVILGFCFNKLMPKPPPHEPGDFEVDFSHVVHERGVLPPQLEWQYRGNTYISGNYAVSTLPFDFAGGKYKRKTVKSATVWHQDKPIGRVQRKTGEDSRHTITRAKRIAERHAVGMLA